MKFIKFLLICVVTFLSINAYSLQLGEIIFKSNQNSPLDVEIKVNLTSEDKIDTLKPSIASRENYKSQGIERTKIHDDISLSLTLNQKKSNTASLRLSSKMPVAESYLDLLIQIESPTGKILREYTVLLDPPLNVVPRKKIQEKKEVPIENKLKKIKKVEPKKIVKKIPSTKVSKKKKTVIAKPGKTLFQIARENSYAGITTEQIVISIYQTNPNAFDGNLNGLIKGKKLILPLRDYYKKLSHLEARKILKQENILWKSLSKKTKTKNNIAKKNKDLDELSRLKKELEIANKKLAEKNEVLKAIEKSNQKLIKPQESKINVTETIIDSIDGSNVLQEAPLNEANKDNEEKSAEDAPNTFQSSITDQNQDIIQEVIIDEEVENKPIKPIFVLSLIFLLTLLLGLLFIVRKKKKEINHDPVSSWASDDETNESVVSDVAIEKNSLHDDSSQENPVSQNENNTIKDTFNDPTNSDNFNSDNNKDNDPR